MAFPFIAGAINDGPEHRHDGAGHAPVLEKKQQWILARFGDKISKKERGSVC